MGAGRLSGWSARIPPHRATAAKRRWMGTHLAKISNVTTDQSSAWASAAKTIRPRGRGSDAQWSTQHEPPHRLKEAT